MAHRAPGPAAERPQAPRPANGEGTPADRIAETLRLKGPLTAAEIVRKLVPAPLPASTIHVVAAWPASIAVRTRAGSASLKVFEMLFMDDPLPGGPVGAW